MSYLAFTGGCELLPFMNVRPPTLPIALPHAAMTDVRPVIYRAVGPIQRVNPVEPQRVEEDPERWDGLS